MLLAVLLASCAHAAAPAPAAVPSARAPAPPAARAPAPPLSPALLSTMAGIDLGMHREDALRPFQAAGIPMKEPQPGMVLLHLFFDREPATFVLVFRDDRLLGVAATLDGRPASDDERATAFHRHRAFLEAKYGPATAEDRRRPSVGWRRGGRFIVFLWNAGGYFSLMFSAEASGPS